MCRWVTKSFDKWKKEGVPHDKPAFPFGTHAFLSEGHHLANYIHNDYKKFKLDQKHKIHGWFLFGKPALSINDVELLKHIQVRHFDHFVDRNESNTSRALGTGGKMDRVGSTLSFADVSQYPF